MDERSEAQMQKLRGILGRPPRRPRQLDGDHAQLPFAPRCVLNRRLWGAGLQNWPLSDAPARRQASSIDRRLAPAGRDGARLAQPIDVAQLGVHRPAAPPATPGYRDASRFARRLRDCEPARCAGRPTGARSHRLPTCPGRTPVQLAESRSCISVARNSARSKLSPCGPIRTMIRKLG